MLSNIETSLLSTIRYHSMSVLIYKIRREEALEPMGQPVTNETNQRPGYGKT
jgi:hypothetical protein